MSSKQARSARDGNLAEPIARKARPGFRVGPDNLPDGPWRRKVTKIKQHLITKAKVKKQYAKVKKVHLATISEPILANNAIPGQPTGDLDRPVPDPAMPHPDRQAMLNGPADDNAADAGPGGDDNTDTQLQRRPPRGRVRKPAYFAKELATAEGRKRETEERSGEMARQDEERRCKVAERERYHRAMDKARRPGRDGKKRLGRESGVLLDRVRKMVETG